MEKYKSLLEFALDDPRLLVRIYRSASKRPSLRDLSGYKEPIGRRTVWNIFSVDELGQILARAVGLPMMWSEVEKRAPKSLVKFIKSHPELRREILDAAGYEFKRKRGRAWSAEEIVELIVDGGPCESWKQFVQLRKLAESWNVMKDSRVKSALASVRPSKKKPAFSSRQKLSYEMAIARFNELKAQGLEGRVNFLRHDPQLYNYLRLHNLIDLMGPGAKKIYASQRQRWQANKPAFVKMLKRTSDIRVKETIFVINTLRAKYRDKKSGEMRNAFRTVRGRVKLGAISDEIYLYIITILDIKNLEDCKSIFPELAEYFVKVRFGERRKISFWE
ncbi:MAG: hypothetical protein EOP04_06500 [Proteobacteria bacterium]|nr:MAG: hypothetical protein EOP04_06500 [Pseudomonadota bacterium]